MSDRPPTEAESDALPEEADEIVQELERKRSLRGWAAVAAAVIGIAFSVFQLWLAARGFSLTLSLPVVGRVQVAAFQQLQVNAIHVTFALLLAFLLFPPTQGEGFLARRLSAVRAAIHDRFDGAVVRVTDAVAAALAWFMLDDDGERVTPADLVCMALAVLAGGYVVTEFDEIQRLRVFGLESGRPIQEVFPVLHGVVDVVAALGIPLDATSYAFLAGVAGTLLVLEATRRALGFPLMVLVGSFLVYARFGYLIPSSAPLVGVFGTTQIDWYTIVQNLWFNTENGVFGLPVSVSVQYIYIFVLFGAFLEMSGAGRWFIDFAYSLTGSRKGGPAKASILASGFMGTISGSSIANTVTTGAFTIPLMKRSGYRAEFAGAVEASASSGGQILPPVMGAAAFLIVSYTGTPFNEVVVAAAIPAVVFFFGVWVMVHLEASRTGIGGVDPSELVDAIPHLRRGWFYLLPLVLLLVYLVGIRYTPARSAWFTIVALIALVALLAAYNERTRLPLIGAISALFLAEMASFAATGVSLLGFLTGASGTPMGLRAAFDYAAPNLGWIVTLVSVAVLLVRPRGDSPLLDYDDHVAESAETVAETVGRPDLLGNRPFEYATFLGSAMESGARTATTVVVAVAAAGIIPGVVASTGLGPNLTSLILAVSGESLVLLLIITAISSIILGMGMPTTVTYIILVSLLGPAISQIGGIPILAAHLFILYFGVIADITPPVAVAAYAASGIAKSDQFQTGVEAFTLSLNKAIVPFAFIFAPGILLLRGTGGPATVRTLTMADVLDVGFFVPEVLVPVIAVFLGVYALGPTVIGYLYSPLSRVERAGFAVAALWLMAPGFFGVVRDTLGVPPLAFDLAVRALGFVVFAALLLKNRRTRDGASGDHDPTPDAPVDA
ncbi:C4-dicarboxylate ABC transporter permease [Halarchaeum grantii]|uniref:C4-dicarboxylate ABC transporter permease n=1 Tax=Halarchaeum grantii TaxID=1193105 RepID=A0A830FD48_9EURY|nr:TRAP transporter fused permease subunit [Halarchaeum grantii]GGL34934.1 C4-dicarboxylate ABC transporter permease [Halarchaeum grantii]